MHHISAASAAFTPEGESACAATRSADASPQWRDDQTFGRGDTQFPRYEPVLSSSTSLTVNSVEGLVDLWLGLAVFHIVPMAIKSESFGQL